MLKDLLRNVSPPVVYRSGAWMKARLISEAPPGDALFDGDDTLFKAMVRKAGTYAEYGCGASTIWVARNTSANIFSTDSSQAWLDKVEQSCGRNDRLTLHWADLGAIGDWGRPVSYDRADNFADYTDWIWSQGASPDVALVDGRFRVCCFLTSLLNARKGAYIVFDDYGDRPQYHVVERFVKPEATCGRQALFLAPGGDDLDAAGVRKGIDQFRFVMD